MTKISKTVRPVTLCDIDLKPGFWYEKQKTVREISIWNVYRRFKETGRFDAFGFTWKEGEPGKPHIFWDSDVAKWIEAAAYLSLKHREPELEAVVDGIVENIRKNRMPDGYFNSFYGYLKPDERFTVRSEHELYCAGHLIEAAIAYRDATGKSDFYNMMADYADLIYDIFYVKKSAAFLTPGHEEIELALVKLYRAAGNRKYLDLAFYFVNERGRHPDIDGKSKYSQTHLPVCEQTTAEGHSVRACYLYCAVADLAREYGDAELLETAKRLFDNIVGCRMYVTGAIGQTCVHEAFMEDFDLPNQTAYAETCANLSLALFARRMSLADPDSRYADIAELVLYNSFLSGISLDGRAFFYSNMQENDLHVRRRASNASQTVFCPADLRVEVFSCSCCPPNVVRTIASIGDFQYNADDGVIYCNQYMSSVARIDGRTLDMTTAYPYDGTVRIRISGAPVKLALRIPGWCKSYSVMLNGAPAEYDIVKGYAYISVADGDELTLVFDMKVRFVEADPRVWEDAGRVAVMRGPLVYCIEAIDNGDCIRDIRLDENAEYKIVAGDGFDAAYKVPVLETEGSTRDWSGKPLYSDEAPLVPRRVRLTPYFAFANRGESDMIIWTLRQSK